MALTICEKHAAELKQGFEATNTAQFKTKNLKDMQEAMEQITITKETFDSLVHCTSMMLDALEGYYGVPAEALQFVTMPNPCLACSIIELGNPDVIQQCIEENLAKAISLGLLKAS